MAARGGRDDAVRAVHVLRRVEVEVALARDAELAVVVRPEAQEAARRRHEHGVEAARGRGDDLGALGQRERRGPPLGAGDVVDEPGPVDAARQREDAVRLVARQRPAQDAVAVVDAPREHAAVDVQSHGVALARGQGHDAAEVRHPRGPEHVPARRAAQTQRPPAAAPSL